MKNVKQCLFFVVVFLWAGSLHGYCLTCAAQEAESRYEEDKKICTEVYDYLNLEIESQRDLDQDEEVQKLFSGDVVVESMRRGNGHYVKRYLCGDCYHEVYSHIPLS